jgi:putative spermidine/putrescine transport system substrate-binding protein
MTAARESKVDAALVVRLHTIIRWRPLDATASCAIVLAITCGATWLTSCRNADGGTGRQHLSVATLGFGQSQSAANNSLLRPFGIGRHIGIDAYAWHGEFDSLPALMKRVDVVEVPEDAFLRLAGSGTFRVLSSGRFPQNVRGAEPSSTYAIPSGRLATVLVYRPSAGGKAMTTWSDFWDLGRFPGSRGLRDNPRGTLEAALLADHVSSGQLYPLDIGRAFRKLSAIRASIGCWWSEDGAALSLVASGRITASTSWNAASVGSDAKRGAIVISNAPRLLESRVWVLPMASANQRVGTEFIRYASDPDHLADRVLDGAYELPLSLEDAKHSDNWRGTGSSSSPTDAAGIALDSQWWAKNGAVVDTMWHRWRQSGRAVAPDPINQCAPTPSP